MAETYNEVTTLPSSCHDPAYAMWLIGMLRKYYRGRYKVYRVTQPELVEAIFGYVMQSVWDDSDRKYSPTKELVYGVDIGEGYKFTGWVQGADHLDGTPSRGLCERREIHSIKVYAIERVRDRSLRWYVQFGIKSSERYCELVQGKFHIHDTGPVLGGGNEWFTQIIDDIVDINHHPLDFNRFEKHTKYTPLLDYALDWYCQGLLRIEDLRTFQAYSKGDWRTIKLIYKYHGPKSYLSKELEDYIP